MSDRARLNTDSAGDIARDVAEAIMGTDAISLVLSEADQARFQSHLQIELARCLKAALSVRAEPVAVKALEWYRGVDASDLWASSVCDSYHIVRERGGYTLIVPPGGSKEALFDTLSTAQAVAQADYEHRIHSALVASPAPSIPAGYRLVPEEPTGEWLSRARHWVDRYAAGIDDKPQLDRIYSELPSAPALQQEGDDQP